MKATVALTALAMCLGCGRVRFGDESARPTDGPGLDAQVVRVDAPPLPSPVCIATTIQIADVAAGAELAVYRSSRGIDALWASGGPVLGVALDPQLAAMTPPHEVIAAASTGVAGFIDTGSNVLAVTTTPGGGQALWSLTVDLASPVKLREEVSLAGREPFASDQAQTPRLWLRGTTTGLVGAYMHDDGSLDADGTSLTGGPVTSVSMEDGPDHSHITWSEDRGGGKSRCVASDIRYMMPSPPAPSGGSLVSDDCHEARTSSGPNFADSMIVVWQTAMHGVEAHYFAGSGDLMHDMSLHGRKPKVRFDGNVTFWIAWIDEGAGDELHLASFDLSGNVKDIALPGWKPVGDEAFQLVRRGNSVYLVVLSTDTLSFLRTTCT